MTTEPGTFEERLLAIEEQLADMTNLLVSMHQTLDLLRPSHELPEDGETPNETNSGTTNTNLDDFPKY